MVACLYADPVIVVVGTPAWRPAAVGDDGVAAGLAAGVALVAARAGASVQVAGRAGDDQAGDFVLLALSRDGVGHAAVLRDPAHATPVVGPSAADGESEEGPVDDTGRGPGGTDASESPGSERPGDRLPLDAGDLQLALRYLNDFQVLVVTEPLDDAARVVVRDAAAFAGAHLISIVSSATEATERFEPQTVLVAPSHDAEDAFAALVGRYSAALDAGRPAALAFAEASRAAGWEPAEPGTG